MKLAGAYINDETYERLAALAVANNRTLAGQCRHLFDRALRGELKVADCAREPAADRPARAASKAAAGPAAAGCAGVPEPGPPTSEAVVPAAPATGCRPLAGTA